MWGMGWKGGWVDLGKRGGGESKGRVSTTGEAAIAESLSSVGRRPLIESTGPTHRVDGVVVDKTKDGLPKARLKIKVAAVVAAPGQAPRVAAVHRDSPRRAELERPALFVVCVSEVERKGQSIHHSIDPGLLRIESRPIHTDDPEQDSQQLHTRSQNSEEGHCCSKQVTDAAGLAARVHRRRVSCRVDR